MGSACFPFFYFEVAYECVSNCEYHTITRYFYAIIAIDQRPTPCIRPNPPHIAGKSTLNSLYFTNDISFPNHRRPFPPRQR